jgi:hypothetical protein
MLLTLFWIAVYGATCFLTIGFFVEKRSSFAVVKGIAFGVVLVTATRTMIPLAFGAVGLALQLVLVVSTIVMAYVLLRWLAGSIA